MFEFKSENCKLLKGQVILFSHTHIDHCAKYSVLNVIASQEVSND